MIKPVIEYQGQYIALYLRISKDKRGRVEGVRAQEKWGRAYAAAMWPGVPVRVFADNDISAFDEDAHRPGYEDLRAALRRGEVLHLWAVEQSRLQRQEVGWFRLAAELDAAGIAELHTNRDGIVRVQDEVSGIKAVLNAAEVRKMKKRQADTLAEHAARGLPPGSRPYGYAHGVNGRGDKTLLIVEAEAKVIREAAERVLNGWSLSSIAADLRGRDCRVCPPSEAGHKMHGPHRVKVRNEAGEVVTADGTPVEDGGKPVTRASTITPQSVKQWLTNATVAGLRVHKGEVVGKGNWEPILDEKTWRAVGHNLSTPRRVKRSDGGTYPITPTIRIAGRRYLLTGGTAGCGVCQAPLVASMKQLTRKRADGTRVLWRHAPYYSCHPKTGGKGCVGIMGDRLEEYVIACLFDELDDSEFRDAIQFDDHAARRDEILKELDGIKRDRAEYARQATRRTGDRLTQEEWAAIRQTLAEDEARLGEELAAIPPAPGGRDLTTVRAAWTEGDIELDEQRGLISRCIERVVVKRATPGTTGFDPTRVEIVFRVEAPRRRKKRVHPSE